MQVLRYHQAYSVAEILCRESVVFKSAIFDDSTKTTKEDEDDDEDYCPLQKRAKPLNYDSLPGVSNDNSVGKFKVTEILFYIWVEYSIIRYIPYSHNDCVYYYLRNECIFDKHT